MNTIYLDNNATTAVAPEARDAIIPFLEGSYFNPSSMYWPAKAVHKAMEDARRSIAAQFGQILPNEILLTGCATESNNTAIFGCAKANPRRKHIITTSVEHPAVREVCKELERYGYRVTYLPVNRQGELDISDFIQALDSDTLMVSIMHANNETGVVFPIEQLARITKETDPAIVFHTDATQTVTKLPIDLREEHRNIDMLSFSGHKFHAPKGVGALYMRRGTPCRPFMIGGHQEAGRRGGTENVPFIIGMARAMEVAAATHEEDEARVRRLRDKLQASIEAIPYVEVNGKEAVRLPNTLNCSCYSIEGESILELLNTEGICASSGSACTTGSLEPSHVLQAMHIPFAAMHGSIRFSLSRYTTESEIDHVLTVFPKIIASLRSMSPYWDDEKSEPREMGIEPPRK